MTKGEKLVANDGYEVMLFPLPYMKISQGENGNYSHQGTYNIDFVGWSKSGRVYKAPMYAPCSCKCVATIDSYNKGRIFQSISKVHTPKGLQYVTFMNFHDNNPIAKVGTTFKQGDLYAHTGTAGGVTGDHTHFNCASGKYAGWEQVPPKRHGQLKNSTHIYDICYVNDTVIVDGYMYPWKKWKVEPSPTPPKPEDKKISKFPWVLYARNFRNTRQSL